MSALRVEASDSLRELQLEVELEVGSSEAVAIVGPSGAGKTTLLKVIAGLHRPDSGRVDVGSATWLDTKRGRNLSPDERSCGFLFQDYALFPHLSAWRNVAFGLEGSRRTRRGRAVAELDRFGVAGLADVRPGELSGGERQRVALARALVRRPEVLLLDEPLAALDSGTRRRAEAELALTISRSGIPVVFVTHSFAEAAALAERVCVVDGGKVVQSGTPAAISRSPASGFVADLTGAVVLTGTASLDGTGATVVLDDGGSEVRAAKPAAGPVELVVFPWEVSVTASGEPEEGSNVIRTSVLSVTELGERVRVVLSRPRGLMAEIPAEEARALRLRPRMEVEARWNPRLSRMYARREDRTDGQ